MSKFTLYQSVKSLLKHPFKMPRFFSDFSTYNNANKDPKFKASLKNSYICLDDWGAHAGNTGIYFYQDLWAARKIFQKRPSEHFDIGSSVAGFIAHVLSFMPVTMVDVRPLPDKIEGLKFIQADATNLDGIADNSIESLSSLCAPEHFGLGRYGDPVDPDACFKAMKSMQRVLKSGGGYLYCAVPVGETSCVAFNAHRIFAPELITETFNQLQLVDFSVISVLKNKSGFFEHLDFKKFHEINFGTNLAGGVVGLFELVKN